jgi:release factor glutamine methyltransferase
VSSTGVAQAAEQMLRADAQTLSSAQQLALSDARREIQLLLTRVCGVDLAGLLAHPERIPQARASQTYLDMFARRLHGEPIAYILNEREFYGRAFEVTPDVLIPRPETELLVECALERLPEHAERKVLDLGTGSGCIAITLAKQRREIKVLATDASKAALAVAARNVGRHAAFNVELRAGSWFEPVMDLRFDVIVSNPPYVADHDPHLRQSDLRFEPRIALCAGVDGLSALKIIIAAASAHLKPGGWLLVEHGHDQSGAVMDLMRARGLGDVIARNDLAGIARVAAGRLLEATP